jgi:phospholipase D1/2
MMIVDDDIVIMGSANINDRSMIGRCDSEIALVVEDTNKVETTLGGRTRFVSEFARSLRMELFREHSGCIDDSALSDPLSPEFELVWDNVACANTLHYREVFRCYPDNELKTIRNRTEFEK